MKLSEMIARQQKFDKDIPVEGVWKVYLVIHNGRIKLQEITEQKKE